MVIPRSSSAGMPIIFRNRRLAKMMRLRSSLMITPWFNVSRTPFISSTHLFVEFSKEFSPGERRHFNATFEGLNVSHARPDRGRVFIRLFLPHRERRNRSDLVVKAFRFMYLVVHQQVRKDSDALH